MSSGETIRELFVLFGVSGGKEAKEAFEAIGDAANDLKDVLLGAVAVAAAVGAALVGMAASAAGAADNIDEGATRTGLSVEAYQELGYAANLSGIEIGKLEGAFKKQAIGAADAAAGTGSAADAYKKLGIKVKDTNGALKSAEQLFMETAEALSKVESDTLRSALAADIYGKSGADLLPLFADGAAGLEEMREQARKLGIVLGEDAVADGVAFSDALDNLTYMLDGLKNTLGVALLPLLTEVMEGVLSWAMANREVIATRIQDWADKLTTALRELATWADKVAARFGGWEEVLKDVAKAIATVVALFGAFRLGSVALSILSALKLSVVAVGAALGVSFGWAIPILAAVVAALGALFLIGEDLYTFFTGGRSVIGAWLASWGLAEPLMDALRRVMAALQAGWREAIPLLGKLGEAWWWIFSRTTLQVLKAIASVLSWIAASMVKALIDGLNLLAGAWEWLAGLLDQFDGGAGLWAWLEQLGLAGPLTDALQKTMKSLQEVWERMEPLLARLGVAFGALFAAILQAVGADITQDTDTFSKGLAVAGVILSWLLDLLATAAVQSFIGQLEMAVTVLEWIAALLGSLDQMIQGQIKNVAGLLSSLSGALGMVGVDASGLASLSAGLASAAAPTVAGGGATSTSTVNTGGNTYNINGAGMTVEQTQDFIRQTEEQAARQAAAAASGV